MAKVKITIDDQAVEVEEGTNLIEAAKTVNKTIPHYCYHAGLSPDGNCRMCLVNVEGSPKPVIGCKTGATDGMVVQSSTPEVEKMRQNIMEFLLINHPLDCPTCDQAGECRLQDYYMDFDLIPSRYKEEKVQKDKMINLGANIMLDEERCIVCTRCVRFCQEIAKDEELFVQERGNHAMVATFPGKEMKNPYAGNTVDVCPVGALTSKDFRYKKRVWFLTETDSVCPGCSRGCNISVHHADKNVFRLKPKHNAEVNNYWMCDAGRYDYKFINDNRCTKSIINEGGNSRETSYEEAIKLLQEEVNRYEPYEIAFVANAQESNEELDAFVAIAKDHFNQDHVYYSFNDPEIKYSDDILITADKNANTAYVQKLALQPVEKISSDVKVLIVLRDLNETDTNFVVSNNKDILALFTTNKTPLTEKAQITFPLTTYAEQDGHFTNIDGKVQSFSKAFDPKGFALPFRSYQHDLLKIVKQWKKAS